VVEMASRSTKKPARKQLEETIKKLRKEASEKEKLSRERLNQIKYLQADFENWRKKYEKERARIIEMSNEGLIRELLPVLDSFEMAISSEMDGKAREGIMLLYNNLFRVLENKGLKKIKSVGEKFDSYYHEAVSREKSDAEEGTVLDEIQAGYMFKSKVIRHSKVKVAEKAGSDRNGRKNK
jgi:molecular chaperone GrpE